MVIKTFMHCDSEIKCDKLGLGNWKKNCMHSEFELMQIIGV